MAAFHYVVKRMVEDKIVSTDENFLLDAFRDDVEELKRGLIASGEYVEEQLKDITFDSFQDMSDAFHFPGNKNEEAMIPVNYKVHIDMHMAHIFGFLVPLYGIQLTVQIYLVLKYDLNVRTRLKEIDFLKDDLYEERMFCRCNDPISFFSKILQIPIIIDWNTTIKPTPAFSILSKEQMEMFLNRQKLFGMIVSEGTKEKWLMMFFEKRSVLQAGRVVSLIKNKMVDLFQLIDEKMTKYPEFSDQIMDAVINTYVARTQHLNKKHYAREPTAKRARED